MDELDTLVFKKFRQRLLRREDHESFIHTLLLHDIFPEQKSKEILTLLASNEPAQRMLTGILLQLPSQCSSETFLKVLKNFKHSLYRKYKRSLQRIRIDNGHNVDVSPAKHDPTVKNNDFIDRFYEHLKAKALRAGNLGWKREFEPWACRLTQKLQRPGLPYPERIKIADCSFVILDLTAVLEKQHEPNKSYLANSPVFDRIESVLPFTTDPTLYRLIFFARKGTALAHAGDSQSALTYAEMVLDGSSRFTSGRQIGNSIFAVVNIMLQHYASLSENERILRGNDLKKQILYWIEIGIRHFENESEEMRTTWRRVYLDKKVYCHLGLDILSRDIPGVQITREDIQIARSCLIEMEKLKEGMEKMRLIHFFVAEAKLYNLCNERYIADGYLNQALAIGKEGNYQSEVEVINFKLHGQGSTVCLGREPIEHDEDPTSSHQQVEVIYQVDRHPCENMEGTSSLCSMDDNEILKDISGNQQSNISNSSATASGGGDVSVEDDDIVKLCIDSLTDLCLDNGIKQ